MNEWMEVQFAMIWTLSIIAFILQIVIVCNKELAKKVPTNYILLGIFTICQAFVLAGICSWFPAEIVVAAGTMTAAITFALTTYAFTTKADFTMMGGMIWVCSMTLLMTCIFGFAFHYSEVWYLFICSISIILFGLFLVYDV
mmetsp:Transcript_41874/g.30145  ORF Transcript_41874/g.30145 Transcript_41874/m.30145 type:complete len:142 (-) Transcript_41874:200-625(-)